MKVGVFSVILGSMKLERALDYLAGLGVQAVELGAGGYAGTRHCPVDALLASNRKAKEFLKAIHSRGLRISALTCAGNNVHPIKKPAKVMTTSISSLFARRTAFWKSRSKFVASFLIG